MADDGGVLGNLPSKRPGKRSAKRETGGRPAKSAETAAAKAARPAPIQPELSGDPVTAAARTAAGVAATGVRVAGAVGRELLRRLPRP